MAQEVSVVGRVLNKIVTNNKSVLFEVGDSTRKIVAVIGFGAGKVYRKAKDVAIDQIIEIKGFGNSHLVFAKEIEVTWKYIREKLRIN